MDFDIDTVDPSTFDFSKFKCIHHTPGEFKPIEEVVPDFGTRMVKYPDVTHIKEEVFKYKISDKQTITKTIRSVRKKILKRVLERRENWKPFGKAAISNDGITTIGAPVFMEMVNSSGKFNNNGDDSSEIIQHLKKNLGNRKSSGFKCAAYRPNSSLIEKASAGTNEFKSSSRGGYIPSSIKSKLDANKGLEKFSIVIKNIPSNGYTIEQLRSELRHLFEKFGMIDKIKILTDKRTGMIKDIAFIDFAYPSDAVKALENNDRMIIGPCILSKERAKSKR